MRCVAFFFSSPMFRLGHGVTPTTLTCQLQNRGVRMGSGFSESKSSKRSSSQNSAPRSPSSVQPFSRSPGAEQRMNSKTVYFMAIANEFQMSSLYRRLLRCMDEYGGIHVGSVGSVLRVAKTEQHPENRTEAFIFAYGCMVVWGAAKDRDDFLSLVVEDAVQLRPVPAVDDMKYVYGKAGALRRDIITLRTRYRAVSMEGGASNGDGAKKNGFKPNGSRSGTDDMDPVLERLAISCALAQSIKLGAFESALRRTIENTRHLPEELASTGKIGASRREVSRLMGQLFLARYRYHLSGDLLMTPAFFWENNMYLPTYNRVERYLEVRERGEVLNKRVEVMQELYKLLGDELTHKNSMALELAITVMIAFEILLTLITLAKESMRSMFSACALFAGLIGIGWALWMLYCRRRRSDVRGGLSIGNYRFREWGI